MCVNVQQTKQFPIATLYVHETRLTIQHFYSMLLGIGEGVSEKSILCMLVKVLKIRMIPYMDMQQIMLRWQKPIH